VADSETPPASTRGPFSISVTSARDILWGNRDAAIPRWG
jgi:hypothetical protein